jgi:hypothetical protein
VIGFLAPAGTGPSLGNSMVPVGVWAALSDFPQPVVPRTMPRSKQPIAKDTIRRIPNSFLPQQGCFPTISRAWGEPPLSSARFPPDRLG